MEYLNKVDLRGIVGNVRTQAYEDYIHANFSVATNYAYKDKDGSYVVETTWHSVAASERRDTPVFDLEHLKTGDKVRVIGRIQTQRYVDNNGIEHTIYRIKANHISKVSDNDND